MTHSRRQILRLACAAPIAKLPTLSGAPAPHRLNIGVGTFSYHTLIVDQMILRLKQNRVQEIELSHGEFMLMKPPTLEMVESARRKFDAAGIRSVSYYTATIKTAHDLDLAIRYARILGPGMFQVMPLSRYSVKSTSVLRKQV